MQSVPSVAGPAMSRDRRRANVAAVLAGVGGFVDAVGFLLLFDVFIAHMSGNAAALGANVGSQHAVASVAERLVVIPVFAIGVGVGHVIAERVKKRRGASELASLMLVESFLLGGFVVTGVVFEDGSGWAADSWRAAVVAAIGAAAMGVQSAALRRVGEVTVQTTFVSGVLTNIAVDLARLIEVRAARSGSAETERADAIRGLSVRLPVFIGFFFGAVLGGLVSLRWGMSAAMIPLVVVAGLALAIRWQHDDRAIRPTR